MNKIFTTLALAAVAAVPAFAQGTVQQRLLVWGPYDQPADKEVQVLFDPAEYMGNGDADLSKWQLYVWENTLTVEAGMDATLGEYNNYVNGNLGWSGVGLSIAPTKKDGINTGITPFPANLMDDSWRVHFQWKATDNQSVYIVVGPKLGGTEAKYVFTPGVGDYKFDGTWNIIDAPVTDLLDFYTNTPEEDLPIFYFRKWSDLNIWAMGNNGTYVPGASYSFVNFYFYKDVDPESVKGIASDAEVVAEEYYSFDGVKLAEAPVKGICIVKQTLSDGTVKTVKVAK